MNFQNHTDRAKEFQDKSQYKDAYAIYAWILNEISMELIDNLHISGLDHESYIATIQECTQKLEFLYKKCTKPPPPPVPPKTSKLESVTTDSIVSMTETFSMADSSNKSDSHDHLQSMLSISSSNHEQEVFIPVVPKSKLSKIYDKLIQNDSSFNPGKELFGGFTSKSELLKKIMEYIHIGATLTEIHHIRPFYLAFQLCLIDQELFRRISPVDFFNTNHTKSSIEPSTHFFNYLCRIVEYTTLNPDTPAQRAEILEYWIKTSKRLYQFRNFQSLKAIISAIQSPPLFRLKGTWSMVSKKKIKDLNALLEFCSEQDNYSQYRLWMKLNISKPMIPYYGIYIHDLTYLAAMTKKSDTPKKASMEILDQISYFQSEPFYSYKYFTSIVSGNIYPKPKKPPIVSHATPPLLALNSLNEESVGLFISHWILSQKFYSEKVIDELSLIREPRDTKICEEKRASPDMTFPSLESYRKNIMNSIISSKNSIISSIGRSRSHKSEKTSWSSLHEITNLQKKDSESRSIN
jgi:hypothetical protein